MSFLYPAWFIALSIIPLIVIGSILMRSNREKIWQNFVSNRHQHELVKRSNSAITWVALTLALIGLALLITAMARPYYGKVSYREKINTRNVLIAMDTSLSMLSEDIRPNRLEASKVIAIKLIDSLPEDRVGIMAFAGSANVITSLTVDHPTIKEVITQLDTDSAHIKGSDLSAAVRTGVHTLQKTGKQANALIILTDGSDPLSDMNELLRKANEAKVQIFCIGMGTEAGSNFYYQGKLHRNQSGKAVVSKLEKQVLQQLAKGTSGEYIDGTIRANNSISRAIQKMDQYEQAGREQQIPKELYQWFLAPGLLFLILSALLKSSGYHILKLPFLTKKSPALLVCLCSFYLVDTTYAQGSWYDTTTEQIFDKPAEIRKGYLALEKKDYPSAIEHLSKARELSDGEQHAELSLTLAQAYYRHRDYRNARICYSDALVSSNKETQLSSRYNMANAIFKQATQPLNKRKKMKFLTYLENAIRGDKGVGKLSKSQLDLMEKRLESAISQYQEALELSPDHSASVKNKSAAEALLKIIKEMRKIVLLEMEMEHNKKTDPKEKKEKEDGEKKTPEKNSEPSDKDEGDQDSNKKGDSNDPNSSEKEGGNGESKGTPKLKPTNKEGNKNSTNSDMPNPDREKGKPKYKKLDPKSIQKFKTKQEALDFLKKHRDSKKKPLDRYNRRFWRNPPTIDW